MDQLRREKQTASPNPETGVNSEQGQYLEAEIVFLEDFHDPWKVSSTK
jgi:hypothetical protein